MKHVGFTGTQRGMTIAQAKSVGAVLGRVTGGDSWFHHGDCIGADYEAHTIAKQLGWKIHLHPPTDMRRRVYCKPDKSDMPQDYLARNRNIANTVSMLIAAPGGPEQLRSGTWSTVRYARKRQIPIVIVWQDGRIEKEGSTSGYWDWIRKI
jgi:hypothetical protein